MTQKKLRRYNDMLKFRFRVEYNAMGERMVRKIPLTIGKVTQKKSNRLLPDLKSKNDAPAGFIEEDTLHDLLRDILLGKIVYELVQGKQHEANLFMALQMYLHSTFGKVHVARERESDIFHSILAMQSYSPFFRVLKRLLKIPGIQMLPKRIQCIYFDIWHFLLEKDSLQYGHREVETTNCNVSVTRKIQHISTSVESMLTCIEKVAVSHGNHIPDSMVYELKCVIQESFCGKGDLDVDEALEKLVEILERDEQMMKSIQYDLFTKELHGRQIIPLSSNDINVFDKDIDLSMDQVTLLLHMFMAEDPRRTGILRSDVICETVKVWGVCASFAKIDALDELVAGFTDEYGNSDYTVLICFIFTFLSEEGRFPFISDLVSFRGIEMHLLQMLRHYVEKVSIKLPFDKRHGDLPSKEHIFNARKSLSKLRSHLKPSSFLSKWIGSAALAKVGSKYLAPSIFTHSTSTVPKTKREKTVLHIIETFDESPPW